jgi:hypothetical protein
MGAAPRPAKHESEWIRHRDEALRIVPDELWEAAHERIEGARLVYLRGTAGRLWGRPANGQESRYPFTGLTHLRLVRGDDGGSKPGLGPTPAVLPWLRVLPAARAERVPQPTGVATRRRRPPSA